MDFVDIVLDYNDDLARELKKLGFKKIILMQNDKLFDPQETDHFTLSVYSKGSYISAIRKGAVQAISGIAANKVVLDPGLCKKLKESRSFVIFDFKSLVTSKNYFDVYKLYLRNSTLCNEHGVDALFVSAAERINEVKSPIQLVSFALEFRYNYSNFRRASERFISEF